MLPTFMVGSVPVYGDLILAPMDGITDLPLRVMLREMGSAMSYTGFINAISVVNHDTHTDPVLAYEEIERPVVFQLFDDSPERMLQAALMLLERNPDIIDVNMGCSAKTVAGRGAGAGLLVEPHKIERIFKLLTRNLDVPITGKIRLGWDDESRNYLQVAKIIEENGGKLVAVHGRTKKQGYTGLADWTPIAEIKAAISIPVIGNGDVTRVADIQAIQTQTGCDAVMIGRGALLNPWLFRRLDREEVPPAEVFRVIVQHLERSLAFYGEERGLVLFRKFTSRYLSPYDMERDVRGQLMTCEEKGTFLELVQRVLIDPIRV
ncbi:MAG: tRNA-dihydrouridine synthase [Anaerolineaceae bacterium]|nr:tRNA-dihydrouridine synthase [Anaerolineaceae bacterium]